MSNEAKNPTSNEKAKTQPKNQPEIKQPTRRKLERQSNEMIKIKQKGDSITGEIINHRLIATKYGDNKQIIDLKIDDGGAKSMFLSTKLLGYDWKNLIGKTVTIVYNGWDDSGDRPQKDYEVFLIEED